jgi:excisionase family DNA binding protein
MLKLKPRRARRRSKDTLTPEDLVQRLGIGRNQVYEALRQGQIRPAFRFGRRWVIPRATLTRMLSGEIEA